MKQFTMLIVMLCAVVAHGGELRGTIVINTSVVTNANLALVPKTGQTTVYQTGDDGTYQTGISNPVPRFTVLANTNWVQDNLTGLIWARNANIATNQKTWTLSVSYCEALDWGGTNDWRLPNAKEMFSLVDFAKSSPAIPTGHPFLNVRTDGYWTSTKYVATGAPLLESWICNLYKGDVDNAPVGFGYFIWPVRGGQ